MILLPRNDGGGIIRGPLPENTARTSILVCMLTLAIYMSALVNLKAFTTFRRRNTLYFWSLLVTSWGIMSHSLGIILKWFVGSCPWELNTVFASFGWWGMVTGQSLVLYSRLHLVVRDERVLRAVLIMIIADFCIFQVPTTILTFGSNQTNPGKWLSVYNVYERIQLIIFTLQELVISVIYIRAALKMLMPSDPTDTRQTKKFLIYLNVLVIVLDVAFVIEVYSGEWVYKTGTQSLAYAVKLTVEFVVLNKLLDVYRLGPGACSACRRRLDSSRQAVHSANHGQAQLGGQLHPSDRKSCRVSIGRPGSSPQGISPGGWPRGSKPRGAERLGPFDEEEEEMTARGRGRDMDMDMDMEEGGGISSVQVSAGGDVPPTKEKDRDAIIITTGITTWSEEIEKTKTKTKTGNGRP